MYFLLRCLCLEEPEGGDGGDSRRKRSSTKVIVETELMFSNETLALAAIDSHKKSPNASLTELELLAQPSKPTVCPSDLVDDLSVPDHLGMFGNIIVSLRQTCCRAPH